MGMSERYRLTLCSNGGYYVYDGPQLFISEDTREYAEFFDRYDKESAEELIKELNKKEDEIQELKAVIQQILYETRANHTKGEYSVIVSVSPQIHDKLTDLLREKMW